MKVGAMIDIEGVDRSVKVDGTEITIFIENNSACTFITATDLVATFERLKTAYKNETGKDWWI